MVKEIVLVGCLASATAVAVLQEPRDDSGESARERRVPYEFIASDVVRIEGVDGGRLAGLGSFIAEYAGREGGGAVEAGGGGGECGGSAGEVDVRTAVGFEDAGGAWCTVEVVLMPEGDGAMVLLDAVYPDGTPASVGRLGSGLVAFFAPVTRTRGPAGEVDALDR